MKTITKKRGEDKVKQPETLALARKNYVNTSTKEGAASIDPDKPLTEKQKAFTRFWAQGESIQTAAYKAGYGEGSNNIGYRMILMPNVLALYNEEKRKYEESVGMTRKKVMEGLLESIEMAKLMAEPMTMISGWREIAKLCGYHEAVKRKVEVTIKGHQMERLTDAELLRLIQGEVATDLALLEGVKDDDGDED